MSKDNFYLHYYSGHRGKFGHEFIEFEVRSNGLVRYANHSNYKNDSMIKKEFYISQIVIDEMRRIIEKSRLVESHVTDKDWPKPDRVGKQEFDYEYGDTKVHLQTSKIGSLTEVNACKDSDGLSLFYYLVQDLRCLILSLISLHFKIRPV
ncbi:hypothetical protein MP228_011506 [Amoeboaphelidium protococcarum]|nr:hypothetical protein MP228_011506 [Amoeboaphelidium protococcarum]